MLSFRPIGRNLFLFVELFSAVKTRFLLSVEMTGCLIVSSVLSFVKFNRFLKLTHEISRSTLEMTGCFVVSCCWKAE